MNPYLESRWGDVHTSLITYARDALQTALPANLRARSEERVFIETDEGPGRSFYPDVEIAESPHGFPTGGGGAAIAEPIAEPLLYRAPSIEIEERFINIIDADSGGRVVTTIKFLSRSNKRSGPGRDLYEKKQDDVRKAGVNLVEFDLLRSGMATTLAAPHMRREKRTEPYHASIWRATRPLDIECYPMPLHRRLPVLRIPLRPDDPDTVLDLQSLVNLACERGRHDDIDYSRPADPPLGEADAKWVAELMAPARAG